MLFLVCPLSASFIFQTKMENNPHIKLKLGVVVITKSQLKKKNYCNSLIDKSQWGKILFEFNLISVFIVNINLQKKCLFFYR